MITRDTKPAKPPGIPRAQTASSVNNRRRLGNPDAKEDKNTGVFTIDDLQRLRETVGYNGAKTDDAMEAEFQSQQRKEMMEKSRARVKNWPNTIENLRNKRIEDKYRKLEEEEVWLYYNFAIERAPQNRCRGGRFQVAAALRGSGGS